MSAKERERELSKLYLALDTGTGLSNLSALYAAAKNKIPDLTRKQVKDFLANSYVHVRHSKVRKPRGRTKQSVPMMTNWLGKFDCDLGENHIYLDEFASNYSCQITLYSAHFLDWKQHPYLLLCREHLSAKTFAKPMKDKLAKTTGETFVKLMKEQNDGKFPLEIRVDRVSTCFTN